MSGSPPLEPECQSHFPDLAVSRILSRDVSRSTLRLNSLQEVSPSPTLTLPQLNTRSSTKFSQDSEKIILENTQSKAKEPPKPASRGIKRFRALALQIKTNLAWIRSMDQDKADDETSKKFVVSGQGDDADETLVFDATAFKAKNRTYGGLAPRAKRTLMKHPLDRTEDELALLQDVVERLKCFQKHASKVKHELARVMVYEHFGDGRVIIQQGHPGQSFYFIVAGKVRVQITETDKNTGTTHTQTLGELTEGSSFGELSLLHNIKRTASVISKGPCDFLRVDKEDFESVLRMNYKREWQARMTALHWLQWFRNWDRKDLLECNTNCLLKEVHPQQLLLGNTTELPDYVHFVVSGECEVVREILLVRRVLHGGRCQYWLPTEEQLQEILRRQPKRSATRRMANPDDWIPTRHLWTICTLPRGYFFGTGEDLTDTYIISKSKVELLLFPMANYLKHKGGRREIEAMRHELNCALPNPQEAFRLFFEERGWENYKRSVIFDVIKRRAVTSKTSVSDVPQSIRADATLNY